LSTVASSKYLGSACLCLCCGGVRKVADFAVTALPASPGTFTPLNTHRCPIFSTTFYSSLSLLR